MRASSALQVCALCVFGAVGLLGQTAAPATSDTAAAPTGPTYISVTGMRASYYDQTLTETTTFGIRLTKTTVPDAPKGLWVVFSIDATPRSQSSTAALRIGGRYYLSSVAGGNLIVYGNVAAGATTSTPLATPAAATAPAVAPLSNLLGNIQGGMGFVWRACHTFNKLSKVNCIADLDYELNAVSTQAVKPIVGLYVGVAF